MKTLRGFAIVFFISVSLVMTATASEWSFYGSARIETFVTDTDNNGAASDTKNFSQSLQSNSRIGANVKVSDELVGRFEFGTGVNLRHLYGEWNFGPGKLLVGQTDSPLEMPLSNQVYGSDENLNHYGNVDTPRQPMLQLTFGNFKIAAVSPATDTLSVASATTEVRVPKVEASYTLNLNNAHVIFAGGYNTYELNDPATLTTHDVDSYILGIGGDIKFGRAYLAGNFWWGQNTGPYSFSCAADDMPLVAGTSMVDNDGLGYIIVAGLKLNDMFNFEAGYGYTEAELDSASFSKDDVVSYYIQSTITLAPGVFLVPEIGVIDHKNDRNNNPEPEILYYGIKWQVNF